ncbi:MAG TPA: EscU/YscU/HrcU family type III secretion system export apparatus switch protein [Ramlibacter sp.]|uniref:EscU/YscU/HrcU family type III secretion system export apparatus switch protein n=1 Tax=Ramlibacter sp. TaxID=1917967 RepID=UPI002D7F3382|nr:EscU/YscU/HrcU family type III secretion system export apparatus switch protein [Ramlibacter sp.]HET8744501.1 EscU/YscU/HrcU family type III secretion system export apparatus switch protein [Ramlibacter sp.]
MAEQDLDRSEAATPFKLQKAREKGQTPRSTEVVGCVVFLAAAGWLAALGGEAWSGLLRIARLPLLRAGDAVQEPLAWALVQEIAAGAALVLWPLFVALVVAAVAGSVAQTGVVFSLQPLKPDFTRLHPAQGLRRIFSLRTLFDAARTCVKLVLLASVAWLALRALVPGFAAISDETPAGFVQVLLADAGALAWKMALALVAVALLDLVFTRREFTRRMRMSRRELKDEFRNREGDPRIRGRLRELRREMLRRSQSLKNTRDADVVLTNPTHYAVALRYVHGEMPAPRVVAKGAGQLAAAMREIAARHRVVVVQNPPLARRLFREAALDEYIPPSFHAEVARIIVWVLAARQQKARAGAGSAA